MVADPFKLPLLSIEEESFAVSDLHAAYAEAGGIGVNLLAILGDGGAGGVERWGLGSPKRRVAYNEILREILPGVYLIFMSVAGDGLSIFVANDRGQGDVLPFLDPSTSVRSFTVAYSLET